MEPSSKENDVKFLETVKEKKSGGTSACRRQKLCLKMGKLVPHFQL
jgi:hypothetical protein